MYMDRPSDIWTGLQPHTVVFTNIVELSKDNWPGTITIASSKQDFVPKQQHLDFSILSTTYCGQG